MSMARELRREYILFAELFLPSLMMDLLLFLLQVVIGAGAGLTVA